MTKILNSIHAFVWGTPTLILILGVGICLSLQTKFIQIRLFPHAVRLVFRKNTNISGNYRSISPFRALCTALAGTVGTGNLAGVAGAISLGGPGAVFWMLICAFLGMAVKCAEATLAVRFHTETENEIFGGPMYMICHGLKKRWHFLAYFYCLFGLFASFGIGNGAQVNAIITSIYRVAGKWVPSPVLCGFFLAILVGWAFFGGAKTIGRIAERFVPIAAGAYIFLCSVLLICRASQIPLAIRSICLGAFSPKAVTGGVIGSMLRTLQRGCSRGLLSNEAGMGTTSIAHASAKVSHPIQQGMMGILEVFLDTFVVCTLTALVILCSGAEIPYGKDIGVSLTADAFCAVFGPLGNIAVALFLSCFAYTTILGWGLYGLRCAEFLFGKRISSVFFLLQIVFVVINSILDTSMIWDIAETLNGLMVFPNLIALILLSPHFVRLSKSWHSLYTIGGTYADFHQRQSL